MKKYKDIIFSEQAFQRAVHKPSSEVSLNESFSTLIDTKPVSENIGIDRGFEEDTFTTIKPDDESLNQTRSYDEIRESLLGLQDQLKELDSLREDSAISEISFADIEPEVYDESQSKGFGR